MITDAQQIALDVVVNHFHQQRDIWKTKEVSNKDIFWNMQLGMMHIQGSLVEEIRTALQQSNIETSKLSRAIDEALSYAQTITLQTILHYRNLDGGEENHKPVLCNL